MWTAGALLLSQLAKARKVSCLILTAGVVILGTAIVAIAGLHRLSTLALVIFASGAAWVLFISLINAVVQNLAPDWVRARVLAIFTLVYMGSFALGSAFWGGVAQHRSVRLALVYSGFGTVGSAGPCSVRQASEFDSRPYAVESLAHAGHC